MNSSSFLTWFRESSPYINAYRGRTFVIYLPGEALEHSNFFTVVQDLILLQSLGVRLVVIHGTRPQIARHLAEHNIEPRFVNGERVTDEMALPLVLQSVGEARFHFESVFASAIPNTRCQSSRVRIASGNYVTARPKGVIDGVDYQFTGVVRKVDSLGIQNALDCGALVFVSHIGFSGTGEMFNVSSLEVAVQAACELGADKLIAFVQSCGLVDSSGDLIRQMSVAQCGELMESSRQFNSEDEHVLRSCYKACSSGISRAQIISYRESGALIEELFTPQGKGTLVHRDSYEILRKATSADVDGVLGLISPLEEQGVLVKRSRELLEAEIDRFFVLEIDSIVVGCASLHKFHGSSMAELAAVATHPSYQGKGLGVRLLQGLEKEALGVGVEALFVLTTQTAHWFAEQGFKEAKLHRLPQEKQALYNVQRNSKVLIKRLCAETRRRDVEIEMMPE